MDDRFSRVSMHVPTGFEAYCRILHRTATGREDWPGLRWADIASHTGAKIHPGVQWHRLIGVHESEGISAIYGDWNGHSPRHGQMSAPEFSALVGILARQTAESDEATLGFWEGYFGSSNHEPDRPNAAELEAPRLSIVTRNFIGLQCDFSAYASLVQSSYSEGDDHPNVMWPSDRSWFVSSEIDFDSTIVGGTNTLVQEILNNDILEALPADPDLDLSVSGDSVNSVPRGSSVN